MVKREIREVYNNNPPSIGAKRRRDLITDQNVIESATLLKSLGVDSKITGEGILVTGLDIGKFASMLSKLVSLDEIVGVDWNSNQDSMDIN
jgi:hypothetical protein